MYQHWLTPVALPMPDALANNLQTTVVQIICNHCTCTTSCTGTFPVQRQHVLVLSWCTARTLYMCLSCTQTRRSLVNADIKKSKWRWLYHTDSWIITYKYLLTLYPSIYLFTFSLKYHFVVLTFRFRSSKATYVLSFSCAKYSIAVPRKVRISRGT